MNTMTFEEFVRAVKTTILDYMPKDYLDATVDITEVQKPGDITLTGLSIRPKFTNISPTFYLNGFYDDYKNGKSIESILCEIADSPAWHNDIMFDTMLDFTNYDAVKDKIVAQLINSKSNEHYLSERVSVPMANTKLDTMFVIELSKDDESIATIGVTRNLLHVWGVTVDDIIRVANKNTPRLRPVLYSDMTDVINVMINDSESSDSSISPDSMMVVCSNRSKIQGAIAILYPGIADEIRNVIGDFYVLPSSIHETILVPKRTINDVNELYNMVHEVNTTQVSPDEVLGCDVYEVVNGQLVSAMHHNVNYDINEEQIYE